MKWGTAVPLPGYGEKVIYPWFDACIGYVSITARYTKEWKQWWHNPEVELYQFIGKDNVAFQSVIFPATQIGTRENWTKLHHLSTTEYLTYEGGKFSKSRGIGVFGDSAQQPGVASDVWQYYLLSHRPERSDKQFNWDTFISSNNNFLVDNFGDFVSRVTKFTNSKHYNSFVPEYVGYSEYPFESWNNEINILLTQYLQEMDAVKLHTGISIVFQISQKGHKFLSANGLNNKLAENDPTKCAGLIGFAINLVHLLSSLVAPYMPETAKSINEQIQADPLPIPDVWTADLIKPGHEIGKAKHLFSRINLRKEMSGEKRLEARRPKKPRRKKQHERRPRKQRRRQRRLRNRQGENRNRKLIHNSYGKSYDVIHNCLFTFKDQFVPSHSYLDLWTCSTLLLPSSGCVESKFR